MLLAVSATCFVSRLVPLFLRRILIAGGIRICFTHPVHLSILGLVREESEGTSYAILISNILGAGINMVSYRVLIGTFVAGSLLASSACFSYKKEVSETPAPATVVVQPAASSTTQSTSTTTRTTDPNGNTVERQQSTTTGP